MAIAELEPQVEGLRAALVAKGSGLSADDLRELWKYKKVSSIYLILNGKQRISLSQMKSLAIAAAGQGEWTEVSEFQLLQYLQGFGSLNIGSPSGGKAMGGYLRAA